VLTDIEIKARSGLAGRVPGSLTLRGWNGSQWVDQTTYSNTDTDGTINIRVTPTTSNGQVNAYQGFGLNMTNALQEGYINLAEIDFTVHNTYLSLTADQWNKLGVSACQCR